MLVASQQALDVAVERMEQAESSQQRSLARLAEAEMAEREARTSALSMQRLLRESTERERTWAPTREQLVQEVAELRSQVCARKTECSVLRDELLPLHSAIAVLSRAQAEAITTSAIRPPTPPPVPSAAEENVQPRDKARKDAAGASSSSSSSGVASALPPRDRKGKK